MEEEGEKRGICLALIVIESYCKEKDIKFDTNLRFVWFIYYNVCLGEPGIKFLWGTYKFFIPIFSKTSSHLHPPVGVGTTRSSRYNGPGAVDL